MNIPESVLQSVKDTIETFKEVSQIENSKGKEMNPQYHVPNWVVGMCGLIKSHLTPISIHPNELTIKLLVYVYKEHERLMSSVQKPIFMHVDSLDEMFVQVSIDTAGLIHVKEQMDKQ